MDGVKIPLTFRIYKGDQLLRTETLTQPVIKIGKLSSSHLRVDDDLVSRMHAVIEVTGPGEISIIDLGSTKGTIVNGQKVNKAKLQDGDVIVLGETRLVLGVGEVEAEAPAAVATEPSGAQQAEVLVSSARPSAAPPPPPMAAAPPPFTGAAPPGFPGARPPAAPVAAMTAQQFGAVSAVDDPSARAIEVAAMLGDSVVAVKHITDPHTGKVSIVTKVMFAIAGVCLLMAAISIGHGISVAKKNQAAFNEWVEVKRLAPIDFRPTRMAVGWDLMAIFGVGGAFVLLTWGLARLTEERKSPYFRIGNAKGIEFPTADAPMESFALVAPAGNDFAFSWAPGMRGEMMHQGKSTPLEQTPQTQVIPHGSRFRVELGSNTFLVSSVAAPQKGTGAFFATLEGAVLAFFAGSALVHFGILALLFSIPPDPKSLALDVLGNNERLNKVQVKPPEEPKQVEDLSKNDKGDDKSGGTGTKQAGEEGKMGKKDSTRQSGQYAMKNNNAANPQLAKMQAMDRARNAGILGSLRSSPGGAFAALTGTGDFSSGLDDRDVYGGLIGNEVGEMQGGWGYGISGTGPGGGGTGLGTIGLGRYGTIGHGSGTGSGYGIGSGKGGMRGRSASQPRVNIGNASATGDLDKNIIRRYIRQKLPVIQHCYEKQLVVKPSLAGTVTTQFTISGTGSVISIRASGIGDNDVENCVADAIRSIQFPKPTGGGIVNVTYPFTFRSAGD